MSDGQVDLRTLSLIGNCQIAMLPNDRGEILWGCWPRFDVEPVFHSLLSGEVPETRGGLFRIEQLGAISWSARYLRNTAILETILTDADGNTCRILDCCPRFNRFGRVFRPTMLIRRIEPVSGTPMLRIRLRPGEGNGERILQGHAGSHHLSYVGRNIAMRLTTDGSLTHISEERPFLLEKPLNLVLGPDETLAENPGRLAPEYIEETIAYWREWVRGLAIPFEWQDAVIRAAISLKLCWYEDTGAIVAALTTSIPEAAHSGRNWDYRFCWLRDSYFTVQALNKLGATRTMEAYLGYLDVLVAADPGAALQPVYGISGESTLTERIAPALAGFRGQGPVRIGNQAFEQTQHDVYGSVILAATQSFFDERLISQGDLGRFQRLELLGEQARKLFEAPDAGIWEFRGIRQPHTFSAAMCWAGCHRLALIARRLGLTSRDDYWTREAASMRDQILRRATHPETGVISSTLDASSLDASLLLLPELGLLDWKDPRFLATLDAVQDHLRAGDFLMRYRHADDFGLPENAFLVCSFWWVNALAACGREPEARQLFARLLSARNPAGLLSEDMDQSTGELWGNFPQTYSLVGIINSAIRLSQTWESALNHG
jgi:GH15 family glucan-1,4-alpha-glucosidase